MKRLPLLFTLLALILLAVSATYWGMQLYQPQQRPIAAAPAASLPELSPDAAATLFGGQALANVASNYQLTGIVAAGRDSVAIIVADGQPAQALKVGHELSPGVRISEVHTGYVMLSESGVMKRIELAADTKPAIGLSGGSQAIPAVLALPPQSERPTVAPAGAMPPAQAPQAPAGIQRTPTAGEANPAQVPGQEPPPEGPPADIATPPSQPQMPPPTRVMGSPVSGGPPGVR